MRITVMRNLGLQSRSVWVWQGIATAKNIVIPHLEAVNVAYKISQTAKEFHNL